jgi:hypothetical protein
MEIIRQMLQPHRLLLWGARQIPMILKCLQCPIRFASGLFAYVLPATLGGPAAHAETTTRLDAIVGSGTPRVGLTEDYRPFSFADPCAVARREAEYREDDLIDHQIRSGGKSFDIAIDRLAVDQAVQKVQDVCLGRGTGLKRQFDRSEHGLLVTLENQARISTIPRYRLAT